MRVRSSAMVVVVTTLPLTEVTPLPLHESEMTPWVPQVDAHRSAMYV